MADELFFAEAALPSIRIESWSSAGGILQVRGYTKWGTFQSDHIANSDGSIATNDYRLPDIPILVQVSIAVPPSKKGECFVRLSLLLGGTPVGRLASGYVTDAKTVSWPPGEMEASIDGAGFLADPIAADPAAGAEVAIAVPTNFRWLLKAIIFNLVTSADVADRSVKLNIDDGSNAVINLPTAPTQAASLTRTYNYISGLVTEETSFDAAGIVRKMLPPKLFLPQGWRAVTSTTNLQAKDDFSTPRVFVERWIEE